MISARLCKVFILFILPGAMLLLIPGCHAETSTAAADVSVRELFVQANAAYRKNDFRNALRLYERIMALGWIGGDLFYNMGNTYFRLGMPGRAILNYERARIMMPGDPDLRYNLNHVLDRREDDIQADIPWWRAMFFWLDSINIKEALYIFYAIHAFLFLLVLVRLFFNHDLLFYGIMVMTLGWGISAISAGLKWYDYRYDDRAVVVEKEVDILAGPEKGDTLLFKLHEGTVVRCEREEDGWVLISLPGDMRGWTEDRGIARTGLE